MSQTERNQAHKIMKALDKNIQTQKLTWTEEYSTYETEVTIYKLKQFYKKIGSLTSHSNNDTGVKYVSLQTTIHPKQNSIPHTGSSYHSQTSRSATHP